MISHNLPIAFTMGDPSGIGPEIIIKSFLKLANDNKKYFVIGDPLVMERTISSLKLKLKINIIRNIKEAIFKKDIIDIFITSKLTSYSDYGVAKKENAEAAFKAIIKAIELAKDNKIHGIVTAPINKYAFNLANIKYPGHTELLSDHSKSKKAAMMLVNEEIKTVLVTLHCSLMDAIKQLSFSKELNAINFAYEGALMLGIKRPIIGVAALNPHAGEGGIFGNEEKKIIIPAINYALDKGIDVRGPFPPDTIFMNARRGAYDVVVSQYHDQALIPIKYLGIHKGINITLGLDFLRTSPDHGTAYDIAGQGIADPSSFIQAAKFMNEINL